MIHLRSSAGHVESRNREDILLNSRDVYNLAMALNLTHEQVIGKFCEVYIGHDSRIPIVQLQPTGVNRKCPLQNGDRCSVHSLKPTVCAFLPHRKSYGFGRHS